MKRLEQDIVRANESEIVLSGFSIIKWIFRFLGLMMGFAAYSGIYIAYDTSDYFSEAIGGYLSSLCCLAPLAFAIWQFSDRTTVISFNQPKGYLTVKTSRWWSIFIPAGPRFIRVPTLVPLPKSTPFVEDRSGIMTYPVRTGPDSVEIRQSYVNSFQVQLPLEDGKVFPLWTTSDRNTYIEIIKRINEAIQDYNQMSQ